MNLRDWINNALNDGSTSEQLASEFADTLNRIEKEREAAREEKREAYRERAMDLLNASIDTNTLDFADAAGIAGIYASMDKDFPFDEAGGDFIIEVTATLLQLYDKYLNKREEEGKVPDPKARSGRCDCKCQKNEKKDDYKVFTDFLRQQGWL